MRLRLKRKFWFHAPPPHFRIVRRIFTDRHRFVRQVRNHQQDPLQLRFDCRNRLVELGDLVADLFHRRHCRAGILAFRLGGTDLLAHLVAFSLEIVAFGRQFAPLLIERGNLGNPRLVATPARGTALLHQFWVFTNQFDVEHAADDTVEGATAQASLRSRAGAPTTTMKTS